MYNQGAPPGYNDATGYPSQPAYPPQGPPPSYPPPGQPGQPAYPPPGQPAYPPDQGSYPPLQDNQGFAPQPGYGGFGMPMGFPPAQGGDGRGVYSVVSTEGDAHERSASGPPMMPPPMPRFTPAQAGAESKPWEDDSESAAFAGSSFSDKAIRHAFIKKVYLILTAQLLCTLAFVAFFLFHDKTRNWVQRNQWFYWCSYATFLITYITLVCCPSVRRKWPGNFICLLVFTLAFSYMTATISSFYGTNIVLIALGITAAVCIAISAFAIQTKIDFTMCSGLIFALSMVLFFFGIACIVVYSVWGPNYILRCVYGAVAALVFSLFLAYDTQMLIGGRKHELSPEEYIFGALQLYLDVVYLFLIILSFFGGKD